MKTSITESMTFSKTPFLDPSQNTSEQRRMEIIFRITSIVIRHVHMILEETLIEKGYLCYPIIPSTYQYI